MVSSEHGKEKRMEKKEGHQLIKALEKPLERSGGLKEKCVI